MVRMTKNMFSAPTKAGVDMLPGANGGAEWSPPAYSPQTHDVYVLGMDQLMRFTVGPPEAPTGHLRLGSAFRNVAPHGIQDGRFVAINVDTGRVAWTAMTPQPLIGGALVTAGNLAFMGDGNGWFDAYDARTGARVWRYQLGAGVNAPPHSVRDRRSGVHRRRRRRKFPARISVRRFGRDLQTCGGHAALSAFTISLACGW
jgi:alcohol dehydrogenase (cytochrome c)